MCAVTRTVLERTVTVRPIVALVFLAACARSSEAAPGEGPVVVELFTSQGCSSCPPADRLLTALGEDPQVFPLAFHVDYWNRLGWRDPFSEERWSERQARYAEVLGRGVYTPQLVVGGVRDVVGSNRRGALAAIAAERGRPGAATIRVSAVRRGERVLATTTAVAPAGARVVVVLYDRRLSTSIERGENAGLRHVDDFVVRDLVEQQPGAAQTASLTVPAGGGARGVVAYVQARDLRILAAARSELR